MKFFIIQIIFLIKKRSFWETTHIYLIKSSILVDICETSKIYGEILSPISEKRHEDSNDEHPVGDGTYMVKMAKSGT